MSFLKAAMVMLMVSSSTLQVFADQRIFTRTYRFINKKMVVGPDHVDKTTLAYGLCESDPFNRTASCEIKLEPNAFDKTLPPYSCTVELSTEFRTGIIDILNVRPWGANKVIFVWRDRYSKDSIHLTAVIETILMPSCERKVHKLIVENQIEQTSEIVIVTSENSYIVTFRNNTLCSGRICGMTIFENGEANDAGSLFDDVGYLLYLENINEEANKLAITIGNTYLDDLLFKYYLVRPVGMMQLGSHANMYGISWSTDNDFISICSILRCRQFLYDGLFLRNIQLEGELTQFIAIYNLPDWEFVGIVCDKVLGSNYHFVRYDANGRRHQSFPLKGIKCSIIPDHLNIKFFVNENQENCFTIFNAVYSYYSYATFRLYCLAP